MYLYKKFYNKNNTKYILFAVSSLIFIGAIGLVIDIGKITLIIYNFACTTRLCIFDAIYNAQISLKSFDKSQLSVYNKYRK